MSDLSDLHGVYPNSLPWNAEVGFLAVAAYNAATGERELQQIELPATFVLDLATRERGYGKTVDAIRKERGRGSGPPFIVLGKRCIRYRLLDVVNHEANRVAYSLAEARLTGLL
jgi:hypothetical protein